MSKECVMIDAEWRWQLYEPEGQTERDACYSNIEGEGRRSVSGAGERRWSVSDAGEGRWSVSGAGEGRWSVSGAGKERRLFEMLMLCSDLSVFCHHNYFYVLPI